MSRVGFAGAGRVVVAATWSLLVALAACAHTPRSPPPSSPSRLLGQPVPAFTRPTLQGSTFTADPSARQVLVVDFLAAYCAPCRRSLPALQALSRRHPQLLVVGISLDADAATARALITRHGLTFPVIHDPQGVLAGRFRVTELPASFVVDRSGRVTWAGSGEQPEGALALAAGSALADLNDRPATPVPPVAASR